jgi:hypothetical protein
MLQDMISTIGRRSLDILVPRFKAGNEGLEALPLIETGAKSQFNPKSKI